MSSERVTTERLQEKLNEAIESGHRNMLRRAAEDLGHRLAENEKAKEAVQFTQDDAAKMVSALESDQSPSAPECAEDLFTEPGGQMSTNPKVVKNAWERRNREEVQLHLARLNAALMIINCEDEDGEATRDSEHYKAASAFLARELA
jgi:hypothetical protein